MRAIKVTFSTVLTASVLTLGASFAPAFAKDISAPREVTVRYDESNMTSESGAAAVYARLRAASRQACAPLEGRDLRQRAEFNACYEKALAGAVEQINRTELTALHMRVTKGVKTS